MTIFIIISAFIWILTFGIFILLINILNKKIEDLNQDLRAFINKSSLAQHIIEFDIKLLNDKLKIHELIEWKNRRI